MKRFDVTTMGGRRHALSFQTLLQAEGHYSLGYEVKTVVADWENEFEQWRVPQKDIGRLAPSIYKRLSL